MRLVLILLGAKLDDHHGPELAEEWQSHRERTGQVCRDRLATYARELGADPSFRKDALFAVVSAVEEQLVNGFCR